MYTQDIAESAGSAVNAVDLLVTGKSVQLKYSFMRMLTTLAQPHQPSLHCLTVNNSCGCGEWNQTRHHSVYRRGFPVLLDSVSWVVVAECVSYELRNMSSKFIISPTAVAVVFVASDSWALYNYKYCLRSFCIDDFKFSVI